MEYTDYLKHVYCNSIIPYCPLTDKKQPNPHVPLFNCPHAVKVWLYSCRCVSLATNAPDYAGWAGSLWPLIGLTLLSAPGSAAARPQVFTLFEPRRRPTRTTKLLQPFDLPPDSELPYSSTHTACTKTSQSPSAQLIAPTCTFASSRRPCSHRTTSFCQISTDDIRPGVATDASTRRQILDKYRQNTLLKSPSSRWFERRDLYSSSSLLTPSA